MAEQKLAAENVALKTHLDSALKTCEDREKFLYDKVVELEARLVQDEQKQEEIKQREEQQEIKAEQQDQVLLARVVALEKHLSQFGSQQLAMAGLDGGDTDDDDEEATLVDDRIVYSPTSWLRYLGNEGLVAQLKARVEAYLRPKVSGRDMYEVQASLDGVCRLLLAPGIGRAFQSAGAEGLVAHLQAVSDRWFFLETAHEENLTTALRQKKLLPGGGSSLPARYRQVRAAAALGEVKTKDASKVSKAAGLKAGQKQK